MPPLLHTPLMSATNAISGISLVGSLVAAGAGRRHASSTVLGSIAVTAATINVVGGFMITDRMLKMFQRADKPRARAKSRRAVRGVDVRHPGAYLAAVRPLHPRACGA